MERYSDLFGVVQSLGIETPYAVQAAIRGLAAMLTLGLCRLGVRLWGNVRGEVLLLAMASCYLMLFNPRTENTSYVLLGPSLAVFAAWAFLVDRRSAIARIPLDHTIDDRLLDRCGVQVEAQPLPHDLGPLPRVRPHDGGPIVQVPGTSVRPGKVAPDLVPPDLRVHDDAVKIEDDRADRRIHAGRIVSARRWTGLSNEPSTRSLPLQRPRSSPQRPRSWPHRSWPLTHARPRQRSRGLRRPPPWMGDQRPWPMRSPLRPCLPASARTGARR